MSLLGITLGCPAGIGPEIIIKYFATRDLTAPPAVVLGDLSVLERCAAELAVNLPFAPWQPGHAIPPGSVPVLSLSTLGDSLTWGNPDRRTATAMVDYITTAVRLIDDGELSGMVTCPIAKAALRQAGFNYPGHTEMLVELTGAGSHAMMMAGPSLKVCLVTIHVALAAVPTLLSADRIRTIISLTHQTLRHDFAIAQPRIAVAGLNPHAGEGGLFGDEEGRLIAPAIAAAQADGIDATGPFPPDTVFGRAVAGHYDAVVCMYHDQGLIPFKLLHFKDGVNLTCGLPIVRTSVDHGTAYDIAGMGQADCSSLAAAVDMAARISANRRLAAPGSNSRP